MAVSTACARKRRVAWWQGGCDERVVGSPTRSVGCAARRSHVNLQEGRRHRTDSWTSDKRVIKWRNGNKIKHTWSERQQGECRLRASPNRRGSSLPTRKRFRTRVEEGEVAIVGSSRSSSPCKRYGISAESLWRTQGLECREVVSGKGGSA